MGKFARIMLILAQVAVSILGIFVGSDVLPDLVTPEGGDEIARGHRAMAMLGAMFASLAILLGAFAFDMRYQAVLGPISFIAIILTSLSTPFLLYFLLNRRITRLEHERAQAASKSATES